MEEKEIIALTGFFLVFCAGTALSFFWPKVRDIAMFAAVSGLVVSDRIDINFVSREWYRGTTRGIEVSFVDILFLIVLVGGLLRRPSVGRRFFVAPGMLPVFAFVLFCAAHVLHSSPHIFGVFELSKILRGALAMLATALYVRSDRELYLLLTAIVCALGFESFLAVKNRYIDGIHRVSGTLHHANSLSMFCGMTVPVVLCCAKSITEKHWLRKACFAVAAGGFISVLLTISRTGVVTILFVGALSLLFCVSFKVSIRKIATGVLMVLGLISVFAMSADTLQSRYAEATLSEEYFGEETAGRGVYLRIAGLILEDKPFGVGLNNWSYHVTNHYAPKLGMYYEPYHSLTDKPSQVVPYNSGLEAAQAAPAHNLLAITAGELGWLGLLLFILIWLRWFSLGMRFVSRRRDHFAARFGLGITLGLCALLLQSVTEWGYRQTPIFLLAHVYAGLLASLIYFRRWRAQ